VNCQERDVILSVPSGSGVGPVRQIIEKLISELARRKIMIVLDKELEAIYPELLFR
jgi:hypothetical protein